MRRAISNSRVTFWAIYGVVTFLWATIPFIIVLGASSWEIGGKGVMSLVCDDRQTKRREG